jgi:hypothetical protein
VKLFRRIVALWGGRGWRRLNASALLGILDDVVTTANFYRDKLVFTMSDCIGLRNHMVSPAFSSGWHDGPRGNGGVELVPPR